MTVHELVGNWNYVAVHAVLQNEIDKITTRKSCFSQHKIVIKKEEKEKEKEKEKETWWAKFTTESGRASYNLLNKDLENPNSLASRLRTIGGSW